MKKSSFKRLGALVMAMAMCFAMAICASALEPNTEYDVTLSGLPASHASAIVEDALTWGDADVLYINPISIGGMTGRIENVILADGAAEGYEVSFEDSILTVVCPAGTTAADFSVPVVITIGMYSGGAHVGGRTIASTLTIA